MILYTGLSAEVRKIIALITLKSHLSSAPEASITGRQQKGPCLRWSNFLNKGISETHLYSLLVKTSQSKRTIIPAVIAPLYLIAILNVYLSWQGIPVLLRLHLDIFFQHFG